MLHRPKVKSVLGTVCLGDPNMSAGRNLNGSGSTGFTLLKHHAVMAVSIIVSGTSVCCQRHTRRAIEVSKFSSSRCWEMMEKEGLKFDKYRICNKICNSTILTKMNQVESQAIQIHSSFTFGSSRNQRDILENLKHALHDIQHPIKIGAGKNFKVKNIKHIRLASGCTSYEHSAPSRHHEVILDLNQMP